MSKRTPTYCSNPTLVSPIGYSQQILRNPDVPFCFVYNHENLIQTGKHKKKSAHMQDK